MMSAMVAGDVRTEAAQGSMTTLGTKRGTYDTPERRIYFFNSADQFTTTVSGRATAFSTGTLIRKRWPSGATAYWIGCGLIELGINVSNSGCGVAASNASPLWTGTDINLESEAR